MTKECIAMVLESEGLGAGKDGRFSIPENREAVCLVEAPGDVVPIERLVAVELRDKFVVLQNGKHERFFFVYENVMGFRLLASSTARERVAGFGR
ncbi:MAG TPA: hypothetical protein VGG33_26315 [Polyangia bacterium]